MCEGDNHTHHAPKSQIQSIEKALDRTLDVLEQHINADLPADAPTPDLDAAITDLFQEMGLPQEVIALSKKAGHASQHITRLEQTIQSLAKDGDYQTADQILDMLLDAYHATDEKVKALLEAKATAAPIVQVTTTGVRRIRK